MRKGLFVVLGLLVVLPLVYVDPAAIVLLDVELLIATGTVLVTMTRDHLRLCWRYVCLSDTVASTRGGLLMTWRDPVSAWAGLGAFAPRAA